MSSESSPQIHETHTTSENKGSGLRRPLMLGGVAFVVVVVFLFYLFSGRYISTDNAYIKSAKVTVTPEVSGVIDSVAVSDNQLVHKGELLFTVNKAPYEIAFARANAALSDAYAQVERMKAQYRQNEANIERAKIEASYAKKEYERQKYLHDKQAIPDSQFDKVKLNKDTANQQVEMLRESGKEILASLANNPDIAPDDHPLVQSAQASLNAAKLDLERASVKSPIDGIVGSVPHVGDYARSGVPLVNLVGSENIWIEANYKETELTHVVPGQDVSIEVDTYPGQKWKGKVQSISPATGSEFSILPAQNATGNWVKIVQRIMVKISIVDAKSQGLLKTGMSTHVTIDTGHYPHLFGSDDQQQKQAKQQDQKS